MSLTPAAMKMLKEFGLSLDQVIAVAEANNGAPDAGPAKSKAAIRTEKWRAKKASQTVTEASPTVTAENVTDRHETVTDRHETSPLARGEDKPLRLVISGSSSLDSSASARSETPDDWPKTGHVDALIEAAASPSLNPNRTPNLITTAAAILVWKRSGASWEHDVLPTVTGLAKAHRGKISTWKFFDDAIARSIADNRRALEIPEAQAPRSTGPPLDFAQRKAAEDAEARRLAFARMDAANG